MDSLFYFRELCFFALLHRCTSQIGHMSRNTHTGTNLQPLPPDPGASRNRAIYNWTLAVADINFFFLFFFRTSQTASLSSSLVLRFGLRRAVCVAQTRSSPHGPPHRAGGLRLDFGCCSGEFRKGTDGCTGDRLQFKLHEASIGFGSPALRPITSMCRYRRRWYAAGSVAVHSRLQKCTHQQCSWCPLNVFLCVFHGRILFLSPLSSDFVPDLFYASFERLIVFAQTIPRNVGKIESAATDDQGSFVHSLVERLSDSFTLIYSVLLD